MRKIAIILIALIMMMAGCSLMPQAQHGGSASSGPIRPTPTSGQVVPLGSGDPNVPTLGMPHSSITQSENPNSTSSQKVDYQYEEVVVTPVDTVRETITSYPDGHSVTIKEPQPAGTRVIRKAKSNVSQELGGSWKDTARDVAAALGSFKVVQYSGIALLLFGAVAFFNPALRILIGGKDTAMAVGGCGAVMMFGPYLFVTYSNYFFLAILAAGGYWFIARMKYQHGQLDALTAPPVSPQK